MLRDVSPRYVDSPDTARHGEPFVDWNGVRDAVARVEYYTRCSAGCVEGEHGLDGGEEGGDVEGLE